MYSSDDAGFFASSELAKLAKSCLVAKVQTRRDALLIELVVDTRALFGRRAHNGELLLGFLKHRLQPSHSIRIREYLCC